MSTKPVLKLTDYNIIALDFDHTLMQYNLKNWFKLLYHEMTTYLKNTRRYNGLTTDLTASDLEFLRKGLFIDNTRGNLLLFSSDGTILRASHGTKKLTNEEIIQIYGPEKRWEFSDSFIQNKIAVYEKKQKPCMSCDHCDIMGPLIFAKLVDLADKDDKKNYETLHTDVIETFLVSFGGEMKLFNPILKNKANYVLKYDDSVFKWLQNLSKTCTLMLFTNGVPPTVDSFAKYILNENWKSLFHTIMYGCGKPNYFFNNSEFKNLNNTSVIEYSLNGGEYCGGNWPKIYQTIAKHTSQPMNCLYIGDSLIPDIYAASACGKPPLDTVAITEESLVEGYFPGTHPFAECLTGAFWGPYFKQNDELTLMGSIVIDNSKLGVPFLKNLTENPIDYEYTPFWDSISFKNKL